MSYQQAPDGYGMVPPPSSAQPPHGSERFDGGSAAKTLGEALRTQLTAATVVTVLITLGVGLAARGLLKDNQLKVIEDGALLGCCGWAAFAMLWIFFSLEWKPGYGLPERGVPILFVLMGPVVSGAAALSMVLWPLLLGDTAEPGTVTGNLWGQPLGLILMGAATWVLTNVGVTVGALLITPVQKVWVRGVSVLPMLIALLPGIWWYSTLQSAPFRVSTLILVLFLVPVTALGPVLVGNLFTHRRARARQEHWIGL